MPQIGQVTLMVADQEEAKRYFVESLQFKVLEDTAIGCGKRLVIVGPADGGCRLVLRAATTPNQRARVGNHTGGPVAFYLFTNDFVTRYQRMVEAGVHFLEAPRTETYGIVAMFEDLYANRWDLIEPLK